MKFEILLVIRGVHLNNLSNCT